MYTLSDQTSEIVQHRCSGIASDSFWEVRTGCWESLACVKRGAWLLFRSKMGIAKLVFRGMITTYTRLIRKRPPYSYPYWSPLYEGKWSLWSKIVKQAYALLLMLGSVVHWEFEVLCTSCACRRVFGVAYWYLWKRVIYTVSLSELRFWGDLLTI